MQHFLPIEVKSCYLPLLKQDNMPTQDLTGQRVDGKIASSPKSNRTPTIGAAPNARLNPGTATGGWSTQVSLKIERPRAIVRDIEPFG